QGLADAQAILEATFGDLMSADPRQESGDVRNLYKVRLNTTRLVYVLGHVVVSWLLLRGAETAIAALDAGASCKDRAVYDGKTALASYFARNVLAELGDQRAIAANVDASIMVLDGAAF